MILIILSFILMSLALAEETNTSQEESSEDEVNPLFTMAVILTVIGGFGYIVWMLRSDLARL